MKQRQNYHSSNWLPAILSAIWLLAVWLTDSPTMAQERIAISGTVRTEHENEPLSGGSITSQGRSLTATDRQGRLDVTVAKSSTLTFALLGFESTSRTADQPTSDLTVTLTSSTTEIEEVVVTALGIEREAKS